MIGTTINAVAEFAARLSRTLRGSNSRRITRVEPSTIAIMAWLKPRE